MNPDNLATNDKAQQTQHPSSSTGRTALADLSITPDNIIVASWGEFAVQGDRTQAIAELFKANPIEQHEQRAWVERMAQEHPRNRNLPADAPSVQTLIFESNLAFFMQEKARAA
jgi:hypothetical protein